MHLKHGQYVESGTCIVHVDLRDVDPEWYKCVQLNRDIFQRLSSITPIFDHTLPPKKNECVCVCVKTRSVRHKQRTLIQNK